MVTPLTPLWLLLRVPSLLPPQPGGEDFNVEYRATNNPADPLRLRSLGGGLMPHRFCDGPRATGPLMTDAQLTRNVSTFPLWVTDNSTLQQDMLAVAQFTVLYLPGVSLGWELSGSWQFFEARLRCGLRRGLKCSARAHWVVARGGGGGSSAAGVAGTLPSASRMPEGGPQDAGGV